MKKGNITKRECYTESCDWDIRGIIDYIEKVYEDAPEIGVETIIARTWEKAGGNFYWISNFEHNRKTAKFNHYLIEHDEVFDCSCSKSQEYSDRITKLEKKEESKIMKNCS